jgi:hypothetical protein
MTTRRTPKVITSTLRMPLLNFGPRTLPTSHPPKDDTERPAAKRKKPAAEDDERTDDTDARDEDDDESDPDGQDDDGADDEDGEGDSGQDEKQVVESDDVIVKFKADGKDTEVPLGQLKRLYGQEAALTRKSKEVAATRTQLEEHANLTVAALDRQLARARERFAPYERADWAKAARDMEEEDFNAARAAAQAAYEDVAFFEQELGSYAQDLQKRNRAAFEAAAKKCQEVLSDPNDGIDGWSKDLYTDITGFAAEQGLDKTVIDGLTDPAAFKLIHMAMLYSKGRAKVKEDTAKSAKAKKKAPPKKIVKGSASSDASKGATGGGSKLDKAMSRLQRTGTRDDAVNAFMATWADAAD